MLTSWRIFVALSVVVSVSICDDFHITVDNELREVCVNGIRQTKTPNYKKVRYLDHIPLPADWKAATGGGCISVEAYNYNNKTVTAAGILACVTSRNLPTALLWKCAPRYVINSKTTGCCSSCTSPFWDNPATHNILHYLPNKHHNRDYADKLPDQCLDDSKYETQWRWDKHRKQSKVCCILKACAPLCKSCDVTGAGYCDNCMFGPAVQTASDPFSPAPGTVCNSQCCVEVLAFRDNTKNPTYIVTNKASNAVTTHTCPTRWCYFYLFIAECSVEVISYADGTTIAGTGVSDKNTKNGQSNYAGVVNCDVESGTDESYYPFLTCDTLTGVTNTPTYTPFSSSGTQIMSSISFCVTGYQASTPAITNFKFVKYP